MSIPVMEAHSGAFRSIPVIIRTIFETLCLANYINQATLKWCQIVKKHITR